MGLNKKFWKNKKVFISGHTGFKGTWLLLLLDYLGADIYGYSLEPNTTPSFYNLVKSSINHNSVINDIRNYEFLDKSLKFSNAEIIFHLAAQPLVQYSYNNPLETITTNIVGTSNILNAARSMPSVNAIINVTSDKCYLNSESSRGYRETDPLGGYDPYSSSKACSELISESFRNSFFDGEKIATARAGNVIGGGDWSSDRLIPDLIRAFNDNNTLHIRNPLSIRPWQHVIEPLFGYLTLAEKLYNKSKYAGAWNFGPNEQNLSKVIDLVNHSNNVFNRAGFKKIPIVEKKFDNYKHETSILRLDSTKARQELGWNGIFESEKSIEMTIEWYIAYFNNQNLYSFTIDQIENYINLKNNNE